MNSAIDWRVIKIQSLRIGLEQVKQTITHMIKRLDKFGVQSLICTIQNEEIVETFNVPIFIDCEKSKDSIHMLIVWCQFSKMDRQMPFL